MCDARHLPEFGLSAAFLCDKKLAFSFCCVTVRLQSCLKAKSVVTVTC